MSALSAISVPQFLQVIRLDQACVEEPHGNAPADVPSRNLTIQYTQTVIPLRDVIPSRTTPYVTVTIIVLNVLIFLYQELLPVYVQKEFVMAFALIPADFTWLNVFTSMFLHGGWAHILGNMLYLWIFGDNVEDRVGHGRFVVFYLLCGVAAALAQTAVDPQSQVPMIGASGAIAGVLGAYIVMFPRSRVLTLIPLFIIWEVVEIPAVIVLGVWFILQLLSGVGSLASANAGGGVAFWAHTAGFLTGVALIFVFKRPERQSVEWWDRA
jgi:membrane associated rhomboid family serine protease